MMPIMNLDRSASVNALRSLVLTALVLMTAGWSGLVRAANVELPVLGDGSSRIVSPQMEKEIGRGFLMQVYSSTHTISDPILKYYVSNLVTKLAQHSELRDKSLQVVLIDSPQVNAFAAPGGVVGINLGLFLHANDVHEYSSVLAHELAHLSQRHFARGIEEQQAQAIPNLAALIAAIAIGMTAGGDAGVAAISGAQSIATSNYLSYSRSRETEADRIGMNTLVEADMDPNGMARMFDGMNRAYRFTSKPPEFMLTHPLTETRIADARTQAQNYPKKSYQTSPDYQMMRARATIYYASSSQAAVATYEKEVRDNPESQAAQYGLALALSANKQHTDAIAIADTLFTEQPDRLLFVSMYAELLNAAGEYDQSQGLLEKYLLLYPDNPPLSMLYAASLVGSAQYKMAENVLQKQASLRPTDIDVWYDLAEVSGQAGDIVSVHRARADYFALHGAYGRAIQHLEYARRLVSPQNVQLQAKLDQRITDLRTELRVAQS
jgi:beta-barrel assembly-enhancing protease